MRQHRTFEEKQNDLRAFYIGGKVWVFSLFLFEDSFSNCNLNFNDCIDLYMIIIYLIAIIHTLFFDQFEDSNVSIQVIFFFFLSCFGFLFFFLFFLNVVLILFLGLQYIFKVFFYFVSFFKYFFLIWKPLFRKFGYLLNFFKKK